MNARHGRGPNPSGDLKRLTVAFGYGRGYEVIRSGIEDA